MSITYIYGIILNESRVFTGGGGAGGFYSSSFYEDAEVVGGFAGGYVGIIGNHAESCGRVGFDVVFYLV